MELMSDHHVLDIGLCCLEVQIPLVHNQPTLKGPSVELLEFLVRGHF